MNRSLLMSLALAPALALSVGSAAAQNLRCGNDHANRGDSKLTVIAKCGEPVMKDSHCKPDPQPVDAQGRARPCLDVDTWSYRPGRGQFITMLDFEQGVLTRIRYGDRIQ